MKMPLFILIIVCLCPQFLQSRQWQYVGLEGKKITVLKTDPTDDSILYAGSSFDIKDGLYKSADGGASWDSLFQDHVWDVDFDPRNSNTMYVCSQRIWKSMDRGQTWFYADSGTFNRFDTRFYVLTINPVHPDTLFVVQIYGINILTLNLYKSQNGGQSWQKLESSPNAATAMAVDPYNDNIVYAGEYYTAHVYKSEDYGQSWEYMKEPDMHRLRIYDIQIVSVNSQVIHIIAGLYGIYISRDGGNTWTLSNEGLVDSVNLGPAYVRDVCVVDSTIYISAGHLRRGAIYKSSINNIKWTPVGDQEVFKDQPVRTMTYSSFYNALFVATLDKGIYSYSLATGVRQNQEQQPGTVHLKQNYPNPFNNSTVIEYEIQETTHVILDIYDVNGKWIKRLVNDTKSPGAYKTLLVSEGLASGLYFYRIKAGWFVSKKKLLLIR